jgi:hypothetical protein
MLLVSLLSAAPGTLVMVRASRWRTSRLRIRNTEELRAKVLEAADSSRRRRRAIRGEIPVRRPAAKRGARGRRATCRQGNS